MAERNSTKVSIITITGAQARGRLWVQVPLGVVEILNILLPRAFTAARVCPWAPTATRVHKIYQNLILLLGRPHFGSFTYQI